MIAHCRREAPLECCGVLGGRGAGPIRPPLRNLAASETRFNADPRDLVEAFRSLRERPGDPRDLSLAPAVGSRSQRGRLAENHWGPCRIIVSLLTDVGCCSDPPEVRVWRLFEDSQQELPWALVAPASDQA